MWVASADHGNRDLTNEVEFWKGILTAPTPVLALSSSVDFPVPEHLTDFYTASTQSRNPPGSGSNRLAMAERGKTE